MATFATTSRKSYSVRANYDADWATVRAFGNGGTIFVGSNGWIGSWRENVGPGYYYIRRHYYEWDVLYWGLPAGATITKVELHIQVTGGQTDSTYRVNQGTFPDMDPGITTGDWDNFSTTWVTLSPTINGWYDMGSGAVTYAQAQVDAGGKIKAVLRDSFDYGNTPPDSSYGADNPDGTGWIRLTYSEAPAVSWSWSDSLLTDSDDTMEYSLDGGDNWTTCTTNTDLSAFRASITVADGILVRYIATPGDVQTITISVPSTTWSWSTGILSGSYSYMEYSLNGGSGWTTASTDINLSALASSITVANGILVRYIDAPDYQTITISAPSVTFTTSGANGFKIIGSDGSMQYSLDGGVTWVDCTADMDLSSLGVAISSLSVRFAGSGDYTEFTFIWYGSRST